MKNLLILFSLLTVFLMSSCDRDTDLSPEDRPPSVDQEFPIIEEISPDGLIGTVSLPDSLSAEMVTFEIVNGNDGKLFDIDNNTGDIYLVDLTQSKNSDNEYNLSIQINNKDTEKEILQVKLKITLSPNLFIYDTLKQIGYVDESSEQGYLVGTVASIDTTAKLDFRYDIYRGNHSDIFKLDRHNGQLTLEQPSLIDYESDSLHKLYMVVSDHDNPKDSVLYYVNYYVHVTESNTLQNGLIGFYPFDEDIQDYSARQNHASSEDQVHYIQGINNKSIEFDGISDYLQLTETLSPNEAKAFSFWVHSYGPVDGENNGSIISKYDKNLGRSLMINTFGPMDQSFMHNRIGAFYHAGFHYFEGDWVKSNYEDYEGQIPNGTEHLWTDHNSDTISTTRWHHCVVNLTDDKLTVYIDNEKTVSKQRSYDVYNENSHVTTYIGNTFNGGTGSNNHFHGALDELRIYNRSLSEQEITRLYQNKK